MQLRLGFELDASVAHPKGEAIIDLDFSAANGQALNQAIADLPNQVSALQKLK